MAFHKALRMKGFDYRGSYLYFVTICTLDRKRLLVGHLRKLIAQRLKEMEARFSAEVDTSVVMENHIHAIIWLPHMEIALPMIVQAYKSLTTRDYWKVGGRGRLWQKGYWEHVIRNDRAFEKIRTYIVNNPDQERYDIEALYREREIEGRRQAATLQ